ncbi:MAG: F420-dependent NADP oxidoreductase [Chloroflexi bacterium RBG_16_60_22]|nr:MAG: F420-dependent NADP oxidoreductase [Chloroflexi bacterium RBG_16_60_22]
MLKVGFIGAGTVGSALAILLSRRGYQVTGVSSRSRTSAERLAGEIPGCRIMSSQEVADASDLVFITTPDDTIGIVASQVRWRRGQSAVHCSGADSTDILEPARQAGAAVGGFHPLQTFAGVKQAVENIPGSTFAIEAEEPLLADLKDMAGALDGNWIKLRASDKVAYHAAAVFACNYLVTLVKMSTDLWQTFSVPTDQATLALLPLIRGTLHNIETIGIPNCLTGPIARGDTGTVNKHLKALREKAPALLSTYRELGRQTVPIALARGRINEKQARELKAILS